MLIEGAVHCLCSALQTLAFPASPRVPPPPLCVRLAPAEHGALLQLHARVPQAAIHGARGVPLLAWRPLGHEAGAAHLRHREPDGGPLHHAGRAGHGAGAHGRRPHRGPGSQRQQPVVLRAALELQLRGLLTCIKSALTFSSGFLRQLHEDIVGLEVVGELRLDHLHADDDSVTDDANEVLDRVYTVVLWVQTFFVVVVVVESQVLWENAGSLWVVAVALECVHQQVQLKAQAQQCPVFEGKVCEQRLTRADVKDVVHAEDV
mmetsp:Transcript_43459/g.123919  ORF Transcript_43459/g.123919 Transcript_43459/m.123919 type:complete len:262 (-) Transcript_43459:2166-2951(-)